LPLQVTMVLIAVWEAAGSAYSRLSLSPSMGRYNECWSAFGLSNTNKWRWWLWMLAACPRTHRLEGRRPSDAQSAFIKWTEWTLAMASPWWRHYKHCH